MDLETRMREAIVDELRRQFENGGGRIEVDPDDPSRVRIEGTVDLDAVTAVIAGSLAGGP